MISIKIFPASYGDCFLFSVNENGNNFNILIDGGLVKTYDDSLKIELKKLATKNEKINLLINTHIDSDHINGLISFLRENNTKKFIDIDEIWYNGLEQIINKYNNKENTIESDKSILDNICLKGYEDEFQQPEEVSAIGGVSFSSLIDFGKYNHNKISNGRAITRGLGLIKITDVIKIRLLSPEIEALYELEDEWMEELAKVNFKFSVPKTTKLVSSFEFIIARLKNYYDNSRNNVSGDNNLENYLSNLEKTDNSIVNNSSIAFVIEVHDKKFLFLGDSVIKNADSCSIMRELTNIYGKNAFFELIKLPHHGSNYNVSTDFFDRYKGREYIVSTNSEKFGHPDNDVLANLIYRNKDHKVLIFNYPIEQEKLFSNEEWKQKYNYNVLVEDGNKVIERRYKYD